MAKKRTRRVQGTGSIFYRSDRDRWIAQATITDPTTGKTKRITRSAKTAKQAQTLLTELQAAQQPADASATTVHGWIDWFTTAHIQTQLDKGAIRATSAQSIQVRAKRLKKVIPPTLLLSDLDAHQLDAIRNRYDTTGYARATQARDLTELSTILDLAVYHGLIAVNKAKVMRKLPVEPKAHNILTMAQVQQLLQDVQGHWLEAWYVLAIPSGARCMEICGMTWDRIDLQTHVMHISHQLVDRHGELRLMPLKMRHEGESRRAPLSAWQVERLNAIRERQHHDATTRPDWQGNPLNLVVTSPRGRAVYNAQIGKDLAERVERLGFPKITPHSFRRTALSLLLAQGVDLATCMKVMGWRNSQIPLQVYAQLTEQGFDNVRNVFGAIAPTSRPLTDS